MSADEDYPLIGHLAAGGLAEAARVLRELDMVRDDSAQFLAQLAWVKNDRQQHYDDGWRDAMAQEHPPETPSG
jgi:hypothetical protein